jgi:hypothetical protein
MQSRRGLWLLALAVGVLAAPTARADLILATPVDVLGNLPAATFASFNYAGRSYKDWGNEPSVAVDPTSPNNVVVSSFSFSSSTTTSGAQIFYSTNGGNKWSAPLSVPAPSNGVGIPNDCGSTTNPASLGAWSWTGGGAQINTAASTNLADQPWIAVNGSHVYVGYDVFGGGTVQMRVAASSNGGASFTADHPIVNAPVTSGFNPGTRITTDGAGNLYSIVGVGTNISNGVWNMSYYLNRSRDGGATWDFNTAGTPNGMLVGSGVSSQAAGGTQASNNWFAGVNNLRGNITAIAADAPGSHIYVLFGARDVAGTDRIWLEELHPSGGTLVASAPLVVSVPGQRAALPSLTVLADGTVVIEYETFDGINVNVHVASSRDFGASIASDALEYSFRPLSLSVATGSTTSDREFGDYLYLTSLGDEFFGTFAGLGDVNGGGIDATGLIDPFFVTAQVRRRDQAARS